MGYIIKDTAALINSKLTDAGRKRISEGTFNVSYFQVGDSEVCYDCIPNQTMSTTKPTQTDLNFGLFSVCGWKFGIRKDQTKMEPSVKTADINHKMDLILHNLFQFSLISIKLSLNSSTTQSKQFTSMFLY